MLRGGAWWEGLRGWLVGDHTERTKQDIASGPNLNLESHLRGELGKLRLGFGQDHQKVSGLSPAQALLALFFKHSRPQEAHCSVWVI